MKSITLHNGMTVPTIMLGSFGMVDIPGKEDPNNPGYDAGKAALIAGLKMGYNAIDTARHYGSEALVGDVIRSCGIPREEIFVESKVWPTRYLAGETMQSFEESLSDLGLDYVDAFLVHWPWKGMILKTWETMEQILASGKAKTIGVSNHKIKHLQEILNVGMTKPTMNQIERHPYCQQNELIQFCHENNIAVYGWSPLGSKGLIPVREDPVIVEIAKKHHVSEAQVILRWDLQCGVYPVVRSLNPQHLQEILDIYNFELDADDMAQIATLDKDQHAWQVPAEML